MYEHVTVVPDDNVILVDRTPIFFSFPCQEDIHAIQWHNGAGHIEYKEQYKPNKELSTAADYMTHVAPFAVLWEAEQARPGEGASGELEGEHDG